MKYLLLFLIPIIFLPAVAHADLGACAVYYAKFYLKDGRVFTGCVGRAWLA